MPKCAKPRKESESVAAPAYVPASIQLLAGANPPAEMVVKDLQGAEEFQQLADLLVANTTVTSLTFGVRKRAGE
jgi:hypothetical protein